MSKFSVFLIFLLLFWGCKPKAEETQESSQETAVLDSRDLPDPLQIDPAAREILDGWAEYRSLEDRLAILVEAGGEEEMKLLLEKEISSLPHTFGEFKTE